MCLDIWLFQYYSFFSKGWPTISYMLGIKLYFLKLTFCFKHATTFFFGVKEYPILLGIW